MKYPYQKNGKKHSLINKIIRDSYKQEKLLRIVNKFKKLYPDYTITFKYSFKEKSLQLNFAKNIQRLDRSEPYILNIHKNPQPSQTVPSQNIESILKRKKTVRFANNLESTLKPKKIIDLTQNIESILKPKKIIDLTQNLESSLKHKKTVHFAEKDEDITEYFKMKL